MAGKKTGKHDTGKREQNAGQNDWRPAHKIFIEQALVNGLLREEVIFWAALYANKAIVPWEDIPEVITAFQTAVLKTKRKNCYSKEEIAILELKVDLAVKKLKEQLEERKPKK